MDEDDINDLIQKCALLNHKFLGVFAANNFPQKLKPNSFLIDNAVTAESFGTHWLLLSQKEEEDQLFFADPLGQSISSYKDVYQKIFFSKRKSKNLSVTEGSANSKQKLKTLWTLLYLYCSLYF